jgi:Uma2 family endonuclease
MIALIDSKTKKHIEVDSAILMTGATWKTYEALLEQYDGLPQRINFDGGVLEVMTLSAEHEMYSRFLVKLMTVIELDRGISIAARGSSTLKQLRRQKGLEPDECFYIANESKIRLKDRIDLSIDPPPDLVVEIDITHHVVDREAIYAAFGVREMWKFDGRNVEAFKLSRGKWQRIETSLSLPFLKPAELSPFLRRLKKQDERTVLLAFRDWLARFV